MNVFDKATIKHIIGTSSDEYIIMKEKSTGSEDSSDPIAIFLDKAHDKEGATAAKGKKLSMGERKHRAHNCFSIYVQYLSKQRGREAKNT